MKRKNGIKILHYVGIIFLLCVLYLFFYDGLVKDLNTTVLYFLILLSILVLSKLFFKFDLESKFLKLVKNVTINKIFVIYTITLGVFMSLLIPLHDVPDEMNHLNMIYEERNLSVEFYEISEEFTGSESTFLSENGKVDTKEYFDLSKKINNKHIFSIPKITIIKHFPQAVGAIIGEVLHLPVLFYLTLIELSALTFYVFVCNIALKKMPFKKSVLMCIMLLPVCLQQAASVSYDVMLMAISFLYIASIFNLKFESDKITLKDILLLILYLGVITLCKLPYGMLGLLIFILPLSKVEINLFNFKLKGKNMKKFIFSHKLIFTMIILVFAMLMSFIGYKVLSSISSGRVLIASITSPVASMMLLYRTVRKYLLFYTDTIVGNLGIFNVRTLRIIDCLIFLSVILISLFNFKVKNKKEVVQKNKFSKIDLVLLYSTFVVISYFIILSMFEWTLYLENINYDNFGIAEFSSFIKSINAITGVQGRYFVPILPLILIPLGNKNIYEKTLKFNPLLFQSCYYAFLFCYMISLMLFRFWI